MRKINLIALLAILIITACAGNKANNRSREVSSEEFERDFKMVDTIKQMTLTEIDAYAEKLIAEDKKCVVIWTGNESYNTTLVILLKDAYGLSTSMYAAPNTPPDVKEKITRFKKIMDEALVDEYGSDFRERFIEEAKEADKKDVGFKFADYNFKDVNAICYDMLSDEVLAKAENAVVFLSADGTAKFKEILDANDKPINVDEAVMKRMSAELKVKSPVMWAGKPINWNQKIYIGKPIFQF